MRDALRDAGANIVYLEDEHDDDTSDEHWLTIAGAKGYVVITKDKQIRLRFAEREALAAANLRAFFLTSGNLSGKEMATILTSQLVVNDAARTTEPPPFVAIVNASGVTLLTTSR